MAVIPLKDCAVLLVMTECRTKAEAVISLKDCAVFLVMTKFRTKTEAIISFDSLCGVPNYDTL